MAVWEQDDKEFSDPEERNKLKGADKLRRMRRKIAEDEKLKASDGIPTSIDLEQLFLSCVCGTPRCNCETRRKGPNQGDSSQKG